MIIDFHSHILPDVDDGSRSAHESLEMLRLMKQQGINRVIATPHFYASHDYPDSFLERRSRAKENIYKEAELFGTHAAASSGSCSTAGSADSGLPEILLGAEVAYFRGMSQSKALADLAIEGTRAILVELPMGTWTSSMYEELELIRRDQGLLPIVAHVDRYLTPLRDFGIPGKLSELPVLVQANASFFLRRGTSRKAFKMLEREQIHLLGSDCHNLVDRTPNLAGALTAIRGHLGEEALGRIETWQAQALQPASQRP